MSWATQVSSTRPSAASHIASYLGAKNDTPMNQSQLTGKHLLEKLPSVNAAAAREIYSFQTTPNASEVGNALRQHGGSFSTRDLLDAERAATNEMRSAAAIPESPYRGR